MRDLLRLLVAVAAAGCTAPADRPVPGDTTSAPSPALSRGDDTAAGSPPAWLPAFGDIIVFTVGEHAVLQRPGASGVLTLVPPGGELQLFSRAGATAGRWSGVAGVDIACRGGVAVAVDGSDDWTLGLAVRTATPLALIGLGTAAATAGDSARLVAELTRLVATLPADSGSAFGSAPFVLRDAARFAPDTGTAAVAALFVRTLPIEADPRAEHVVLIAERAAGRARGGWRVAYADRTTGPEDAVETPDLLAAVRMHGTALPTLFVGTDGPEGTSVRLLERAVTGGTWHERWSSALASCR